MSRTPLRAMLPVIVICAIALGVPTAWSAPNDVAITGVWDKDRCPAAACGSADPKLKSGDPAAGVIQIAVQAKSSLGLGWVRVEARPGTGLWYCIKQWDAQGSRNFSNRFDWDTYAWTSPVNGSGCSENVPHFHGDPAANDTYAMRVVAHEGPSGIDGASQQFSLRFNNPPKAPQWERVPALSGAGYDMVARFSWPPNVEPDMVEYGVVRTDPAGATTTLYVDAYKKGGQPCGRNASGNLECADDRFDANSPSGTYRYSIVAYRRSGVSAPPCRTKLVACVASAPSSTQTVRVTGKPAPATVAPTTSSTPTEAPGSVVQPSAIVQIPREPSPSPTSSSVAAPRNPSDGPSRSLPVGVATTLAAATALLHLRMLVRVRRLKVF